MSLSIVLVCLSVLFFAAGADAATTVSAWATVPLDPTMRLTPLPSLSLNSTCSPPPPSTPTLTLDSSQPLQPLIGYGAAMTETTAYNFLLLKHRNASAYTQLLLSLFAPPPQGIALSFMRVPITSSDLSLPTPGWSYDDTANDTDLSHFNTSHGMAYQIPVLLDVMQVVKQTGGEVRLIGSPWSAPAWIKDSGAWGYGTIRDELYPWYAKYLVKLVQTFSDLGLPLYGLTLQNEPRFEPGSYPGTRLSPLNETNLANLLHPALRAAGLDTLVAAYDHNWDLVEYPLEVMQGVGGAGKTVDVMAFHCYAGVRRFITLHSPAAAPSHLVPSNHLVNASAVVEQGVENQTVFHNAYPTVPIWFTGTFTHQPHRQTQRPPTAHPHSATSRSLFIPDPRLTCCLIGWLCRVQSDGQREHAEAVPQRLLQQPQRPLLR